MLSRLYQRFRNLILYGIIGSFTSALDFAVFTMLSKYIGIHYIVANCISVLIGISTSFALNRSINFKVKDKTGKRFLIFLTVGVCGLLLTNEILYVGIDLLSGDELIVTLAYIVLVVGFPFILNKLITFKEK